MPVQNETKIQTPPVPCSVCSEVFQPSDDLDFVCSKCQTALVGHCDCDSDDVHIDWGVETEGQLPYFWIVECVCGNELKSRLHSLQDVDVVAKELHKEWCLRLPTSRALDAGGNER
jgi:hypothetical protein